MSTFCIVFCESYLSMGKNLISNIGNQEYLPNHDNGEVEYVPWVLEVGVRVRDEAVRHNFHAALARKDHREDHFYRFLRFRVSVNHMSFDIPRRLWIAVYWRYWSIFINSFIDNQNCVSGFHKPFSHAHFCGIGFFILQITWDLISCIFKSKLRFIYKIFFIKVVKTLIRLVIFTISSL